MSRLTLTPEQRRIITHAGSTLLIHAVAGSGKTTTLAHCIAQAERQGMPADAILALVFSDTARDVFLQRLKTAAASRHVQVMTYRQFADSLLAHWSAHSLINPVEQPQAESDALRPILF
ncbi:MAG: UvrD-helicase domain-containing protein, partial [Pigmentiphaga sp.]|nr:UvrD-helicase domain-containing protein [Pigmentiphaga sp.]